MSEFVVRPTAPRRIYVHAGFWWRVLAYVIDAIIIAPVNLFVTWLLPHREFLRALPGDDGTRVVLLTLDQAWGATSVLVAHPLANTIIAWVLGQLAASLVALIYNVAFIASPLQATPGKLACGLRVTGLSAQRLGIGRALARQVLVDLSIITIVGVLMAGWTRRKQALHDLLAGTLVLRATHADPVMFVPTEAR